MLSAPILIIGQGLAGTALAWTLHEQGVPFLIVDRDEPVTSSKIAAGLLTPITGMRISLSSGYAEQWPEARSFYRRIEKKLGLPFLVEVPHVRLFKNDVEPERWAKRKRDPALQPFVEPGGWSLDSEVFTNPRGGFQMKHSGWLDTKAYLEAGRRFFTEQGAVETAEVKPEEVEPASDHVIWRGRRFSHVVWCQGWEAMKHPLFDWVPFKAARGTILTVRADVGDEQRVIHRGCWMVPRGDGTMKVGSTYDTRFSEPTETLPQDLTTLDARLRAALKVPFEVLDHASAVRPITEGQRTLIGRHPAQERVLFFNGLSSKGTLRAPFYARLLADHLLRGAPLPASCDLRSNL